MDEDLRKKGAKVSICFSRTINDTLQIENKEAHPQLIPVGDGISVEKIPPDQPHEVTVKVMNFVYGTGGDPNKLYAKFLDSPTATSDVEAGTDRLSNKQAKSDMTSQSDEQNNQTDPQPLNELSGDGSRIDLKVWVASVSDHGSSKVLQTGNLADDSVEHTPPFIIFDGQNVQPLKSKKLYLLCNVKDNYYEEQDRIQVVIDDYSNIVSHGRPSGAPDSISTSKSDHETYNNLADAAADQLEAGLSPSESPEEALSDEYRNR